jgi:hypothetical protein
LGCWDSVDRMFERELPHRRGKVARMPKNEAPSTYRSTATARRK